MAVLPALSVALKVTFLLPLLLVSTCPVSVPAASPEIEASGALCVIVFSPLLRANGPATGQQAKHRRTLVDLNGDDVAGGAAVAGVVNDRLRRRSDCAAFAAQPLVGRAVRYPGQVVATGEVDGDVAIVPAGAVGSGRGGPPADGGRCGVALDRDSSGWLPPPLVAEQVKVTPRGVAGDALRVAAGLAGDGRLGVGDAPAHAHIAGVPAVVAQRP